MKLGIGVCLTGSLWIGVAGGQEHTRPVLKPGVHVEMAVADHPVQMRAADELDATVVAITVSGKVFLGVRPATLTELSNLAAETVYVKADSRVPFQSVLTVLEALRGKSVGLLTESPQRAEPGRPVPPYGMKVTVAR